MFSWTPSYSVSKKAFASFVAVMFFMPAFALADSVSVDFENPPYTTGTINAQDGWSSLGAAGLGGCAVYDHAVDSSFSTPGFGLQSLRISNAVTSGCFGDQTFSKSLIDEAGETGSTNAGMSGGTRQNHFEAQFDVATASTSQQLGLSISVSPDRGDGSRMSYLRFEDNLGGIDVFFVDTPGTTDSDPIAPGVQIDFPQYPVATGLSRATAHNAKFVIDYVDGPSNDVVKIYIDGVLVHTGTTWENYYRFDSEASAEQTPRTTDSLIFRTGGTAAPANADKGFLFDNLTLFSGATPSPTPLPRPVCIDSNVNHACDSGELTFLTIQAAVTAASSTFSDTIQVTAGTYPELVTVDKTVTINGAQVGVDARTRVVSVPSESIVGMSTGAFQILADNVVIDGFTVTGVTSSLNAGIHTNGATSGHTILNNIIRGNVMGIWLNSNGVNTTTVSQNLIDNNNMPGSNSGTGIDSELGLSKAVISNNKFTGAHAFASIYLANSASSDITVDGNILDNEISLANINGGTVTNNISINSLKHGIELTGGNNDLIISGNVITGINGWSAIRIHNGGNGRVTIINNSIKNSTSLFTGFPSYGINSEDPAATVLANFNDLSNNDVALRYEPSVITTVPNPVDAQNNWWGCATGPSNPSVSPCGLVEGNPLLIDSNPWLATLDLAGNNPVTGKIVNSAGTAVGFGTGLQDGFSSTGANPASPVTAAIGPGNTASYSFNFIGPNPGDTTVSGMVLFAGQDSTLASTLVINTPPGGGGGGGGGGSSNGTLTVEKVIWYGADTGATFPDFSFTVGGGTHQFEADGANQISLNSGTYTVAEVPGVGFTTAYSGDCDSSGQVFILSGQSATCVVTNTFAVGGFNPGNEPTPTPTPTPPAGNTGGGTSGSNPEDTINDQDLSGLDDSITPTPTVSSVPSSSSQDQLAAIGGGFLGLSLPWWILIVLLLAFLWWSWRQNRENKK